jgi:hypothetical protein
MEFLGPAVYLHKQSKNENNGKDLQISKKIMSQAES